jgi:hypothetical protein
MINFFDSIKDQIWKFSLVLLKVHSTILINPYSNNTDLYPIRYYYFIILIDYPKKYIILQLYNCSYVLRIINSFLVIYYFTIQF